MPVQDTSDTQIWIASAGGGDAVVRISLDGTVGGGTSGYDIVSMLAGHPQLQQPIDVILDTVHDRFFIVDSDGTTDTLLQGSISQALAGGNPPLTVLYAQTPAVSEGEGITGVAIDPENGVVYFTERNLVQKVDYDIAGQTPVTLADLGFDDISGMPNYANEIAFNPVTGQIFVASTESSTDFVESPPGSGNFIIGTLVTRNAIFRIDNISPADTDDSGNTITKLEWDTHEQMHPYLGGPDTGFFPDELGLITGIDVDTATGQVYFTAVQLNGGGGGEVGGIYSIGANGGAHTVLYSETNATAQNFQYIDVDNGRYFVTSEESGTHAVYTHDLTPGAPTLVASVGAEGGLTPAGLHVSNAPTLAVTDAPGSATEAAGPGSGFSSDAFGISFADAGDLDDSALLSDELAGASVRISDGFGSAAGSTERLTINGTTAGSLPSGISYSYDSGTGVMTLTGIGTFAEYEAALALVAYSISGDNPDAYGTASTRTLAYSVTDGLLHSDEQEATVDVAATNDAPVNTVGGAFAVLETDGPTAVTGLAVSDVDADPAIDLIEVTLSATLGTIAVATGVGGGITPGQVAGNGTGTVVITATQDAINATFAAAGGVTYDPATDGVDALTMTTSDLGNGGAGGAQQDVDAVVITVLNVNQDPTTPAAGSVSTAEDITSAATPIGADDPDDNTLTYSEKPGFEAANGTVTFDQLNGTFTYAPDADFHGSDSFTILIDDGNGGIAEQVVSVTVTPVNDDPTAPAAGSATATEDGATAPTAIGADDVDNDTLTYSEKAGAEAANGTVSFDQLGGTFTYTPDADFNGSDSFTILIDDGNGGTAEQVVSVTVSAVNDAPTVAGDGTEEAPDIVEDTPSSTGQTVSALFAGQYSDATDQVAGGSSADAFAGVAVTANGSSPATGQWQYHNGASWVNIGPASTGAAVLLSSSTAVRFNPASGFVGPAPSLTTHLVDASGGAIVSGALADLSVTGGTTQYSSGTVVLSQDVLDGNSPPTGVTGTLAIAEFPNNGAVVGTVTGQDPDSTVLTYALVNDAGGRFDINTTTGVVTVQDGLLIDYEQQASHTIRVAVTDDQGDSAEFDMVVAVNDVHGEFESGDSRANVMVGGAESDIFIGGTGSDTLSGGGGSDLLIGGAGIFDFGNDGDVLNGGGGIDILYGGGGNDTLDGGAQSDLLIGDDGNDVFKFHKGQADGDTVLDFAGNGAAAGDSIVLQGYAAGTTFTRVGGSGSDLYKINDHGFVEYVTILGAGNVHISDVTIV
jgi:hypothetical protein